MIIELAFTFDDHFRHPTIKIGIDDMTLYNGAVQTSHTFDCTLKDGPHDLWIEHHGKDLHETNNEHDTHVYIKSIVFDGVDLDQLDYCKLTHRGKFYPDYAESYRASCSESGTHLSEYIQPNHYLGHNGTWHLSFNTPELLWIITEQNPSGMHLEDTMFSTSSAVLTEIKDFFKL
jgi:hypothetical protein